MLQENVLYALPRLSASKTGIAAGYLVTGLVACPAILFDWFYSLLNQSLKAPLGELSSSQSGLFVYDIPHLLCHEEMKGFPLYRGGVFSSSRPIKVTAETLGSLANALTAAFTYVTVGLLEIGLLLCSLPLVFLLGVAAMLATSIYCIAGSYRKGFESHCIETVNYLSDFL